MSVVVVERDMITACGRGPEAAWRGILCGRHAFSTVRRFSTDAFQCHVAALIPTLDQGAPDSLVMQMLGPLLHPLAGRLPEGTCLILASTVGEIDLLERHASSGQGSAEESRLDRLLDRINRSLGGDCRGRVVSAACASASAAVALAGMLIDSGQNEAVLVVACDAVSEFVYSGFSSLMALDPEGARPFDRSRKGLTIGEAAGYVLLMSGAAAARSGRKALCELAGWGLSCDANHMTGSSRDGIPLSAAISRALKKADVDTRGVGSISAHGTGTLYNDSMEMKAFRRSFGDTPVPTYSIKGAVGHTMGAAGLVDMLVAISSLDAQVVPPSVNLRDADPEAAGWVSAFPVPAPGMRVALSTNSGFGGVNTALVLRA